MVAAVAIVAIFAVVAIMATMSIMTIMAIMALMAFMANQAAPPAFKDLTESEYQKVVSKPVVQSCDMVPAEQANEAVEVISMAVDKHVSTGNYEAMCKIVKETMDRKYGPQWHCAIGEGFGFDVTYQQPNMIYVYYGKIGILLFKC